MIKLRLLFFLSVQLMPSFSFGQELILNESFEESTRNTVRPDGKWRNKLALHSIENTIGITPDYYNSWNEILLGSRKSNSERVMAADGNKFIGLHLNVLKNEFLQLRLNKQLEEGENYCVSLYLRLSKNSKFKITSIDVILSSSEIDDNPYNFSLDSNTRYAIDSGPFDNIWSWTQLCDTYEAEGGEQYLLIGSFFNSQNDKIQETNFELKKRKFHLDKNGSAYYLIDHVSLTKKKKSEECVCQSKLTNILYQNTSGDRHRTYSTESY